MGRSEITVKCLKVGDFLDFAKNALAVSTIPAASSLSVQNLRRNLFQLDAMSD